MEKIHNEFKLKLLEGIVDNLDEKQPGERNQDNSLSLNFEKENQGRGTANNKRNDVYKVQVTLFSLLKFEFLPQKIFEMLKILKANRY